jgi:hypothetical protein
LVIIRVLFPAYSSAMLNYDHFHIGYYRIVNNQNKNKHPSFNAFSVRNFKVIEKW